MDYIFVDSRKNEDYIGVVEDGRLVEIYVEEKDNRCSVGDIYRGRVENVVRGIDAAFVDIGLGKNGYLYLKDALTRDTMYLKNNKLSINDVLKNTEDVIVQIIKEPKGDKGVKLTRHITIPGSYIVLTPFSNRINISKKIDSENSQRLRIFGRSILIDDIGFVLRTNSQDVDEEKIRVEYEKLVKLYKKIEREKNFLPCPKLIYKDVDFLYKLINSGKFKEYKVVVNDKKLYGSLLELDGSILIGLRDRLLLQDFSLERDEVLFRDLRLAMSRKIKLECGGTIVIDRTEAMTVVDVNSGAFKGDHLEETIRIVNYSAMEEIARQIRLRNISGIIIVDFIDFKDKSLEDDFIKAFNKELARDENRAIVVGMTKLGLVEITRKKIRVSDLEYFEEIFS